MKGKLVWFKEVHQSNIEFIKMLSDACEQG